MSSDATFDATSRAEIELDVLSTRQTDALAALSLCRKLPWIIQVWNRLQSEYLPSHLYPASHICNPDGKTFLHLQGLRSLHHRCIPRSALPHLDDHLIIFLNPQG